MDRNHQQRCQRLSPAHGSGVGIRRQRRSAKQGLHLQRQRRSRSGRLVLEKRGRQNLIRSVELATDRAESRSNQARRRQGTQRARSLRHVWKRQAVVLGLAGRAAVERERPGRHCQRLPPCLERRRLDWRRFLLYPALTGVAWPPMARARTRGFVWLAESERSSCRQSGFKETPTAVSLSYSVRAACKSGQSASASFHRSSSRSICVWAESSWFCSA